MPTLPNIFPSQYPLPISLENDLREALTVHAESGTAHDEANVSDGGCEIADVFRRHWDEYQKSHSVTPRQYKVVYDILRCRTGDFGYSISACDSCGHAEVFPNSCRNSHCPKCLSRKYLYEMCH